MRAPGILLLCGIPALAELQRSPEVFGQAGVLRLGADEGSAGRGASSGGLAMLPITPKFAADVEALTAKVSSAGPPGERFSLRRTMVLPALVRRWGDGKVYGFVGGGVGMQLDRTHVVSSLAGLNFRGSDTGMTLHGKGGVVAALTPRLLVRGDALIAFRYVLPSIGLRIGLGYRF
jgi:hypothetical protein